MVIFYQDQATFGGVAECLDADAYGWGNVGEWSCHSSGMFFRKLSISARTENVRNTSSRSSSLRHAASISLHWDQQQFVYQCIYYVIVSCFEKNRSHPSSFWRQFLARCRNGPLVLHRFYRPRFSNNSVECHLEFCIGLGRKDENSNTKSSKAKRGESSNWPASPISKRYGLLDSPITSLRDRTLDQTGGTRHTGRQLTNQRPAGDEGRSLMTSPQQRPWTRRSGKPVEHDDTRKNRATRISMLHSAVFASVGTLTASIYLPNCRGVVFYRPGRAQALAILSWALPMSFWALPTF